MVKERFGLDLAAFYWENIDLCGEIVVLAGEIEEHNGLVLKAQNDLAGPEVLGQLHTRAAELRHQAESPIHKAFALLSELSLNIPFLMK